MPGGSGGGKGGKASNAALHDDEDRMARMRKTFHAWVAGRKKKATLIHYVNSPKPMDRKFGS